MKKMLFFFFWLCAGNSLEKDRKTQTSENTRFKDVIYGNVVVRRERSECRRKVQRSSQMHAEKGLTPMVIFGSKLRTCKLKSSPFGFDARCFAKV